MRDHTISTWAVTRSNGERVMFESATEREAQLLARESFPDDSAFEVQLVATICERCRASIPAGERCEPCRANREARKRSYLVRVSFLVRAGWTPSQEVRVRALSVVGAAALGVRQAKRESVKRGARIAQTKIEIVAVRKQAGR